MRRPFFKPLRTLLRGKAGARMSDARLLSLWRHVSTEAIRALGADDSGTAREREIVNEARGRLLRLREAEELSHDPH